MLFGNILNYVFEKYHTPTCFAFIGLILGSIPAIIKQTNSKKIDITHVLCLFLTFSFSIFLVALENSSTIPATISDTSPSFMNLITSGMAMSAGVVIPGVSSSVILMIMGIYQIYLSAIASLNLLILIPLGIGLVLGGFLFLKLIQFFLKQFPTHTYFAIIGFVLGSIPVLYPGFQANLEGIISILLFLFCFFLAKKLESIHV